MLCGSFTCLHIVELDRIREEGTAEKDEKSSHFLDFI